MVQKVCVVFRFLERYRPMHLVRIEHLTRYCDYEIICIKVNENDKDVYERHANFRMFSINEDNLVHLLDNINPDVIITNGYADLPMRQSAIWAKRNNKLSILMSDTQYIDRPRNWLKEKIKSYFINKYFNSAFVSGVRAEEYLKRLGVTASRIWRGYDVVDNKYFEERAKEIRQDEANWRNKFGLPEKYFLFVGRFSLEKNLFTLLRAYKRYREEYKDSWGLVLVGSGPQEEELKNFVVKENLKEIVFPGFKQIDELPYYYALASSFILPSVSETWGLPVNEAMASGLPVLVSESCGCVPELVYPGINGYIFNPFNVEEIVYYMNRISSGEVDLKSMGEASKKIISNFTPETWAKALKDCIVVTSSFLSPCIQ